MDLNVINKIIIESRKREQLVSEADNLISDFDKFVILNKQKIMNVDVEKTELIKEIQENSKSGDIKELKKLLERL